MSFYISLCSTANIVLNFWIFKISCCFYALIIHRKNREKLLPVMLTHFLKRSYGYIHWLWLALALTVCFSMVFLTPPFQVPDEPAHFIKAAQVSVGNFSGIKDANHNPGAYTPTGPVNLVGIKEFHLLSRHKERKIDVLRSTETRPSAVKWGERLVFSATSAINYPPTGYLFHAIALRLSQALHINVLSSFFLARLFNALGCVALSCMAIALSTRGKWYLFILLSLPMTLFQFASLSQDGVLISSSALGSAMLSRYLDEEGPVSRQLTLIFGSIFFFLVATLGKPVYMPLLLAVHLVVLMKNKDYVSGIILSTFSSLTIVCLWYLLNSTGYSVSDPEISIVRQIYYIYKDPIALVTVVLQKTVVNLTKEASGFIGIIGWRDTELPIYSYGAVKALLALVLLMNCYAFIRQRQSFTLIAAVALAIIVSMFLVSLALYITWTPVGLQTVHGVQGRYMIPIACFASVAMVDNFINNGFERVFSVFFALATVLVMFFVDINSVFVVLERYYY